MCHVYNCYIVNHSKKWGNNNPVFEHHYLIQQSLTLLTNSWKLFVLFWVFFGRFPGGESNPGCGSDSPKAQPLCHQETPNESFDISLCCLTHNWKCQPTFISQLLIHLFIHCNHRLATNTLVKINESILWESVDYWLTNNIIININKY